MIIVWSVVIMRQRQLASGQAKNELISNQLELTSVKERIRFNLLIRSIEIIASNGILKKRNISAARARWKWTLVLKSSNKETKIIQFKETPEWYSICLIISTVK